jgi:hypothetical protein
MTLRDRREESGRLVAGLSRLLTQRRGLLALYLIFAAAYLGASGGRLRQHSFYNHDVYLADGWLHGRLALAGPPPNENDWAKVDVLTLRDGRSVRGWYGGRGGPPDRFYPLRGGAFTVAAGEIVGRQEIRYVSFPPLPAVLMLPFVAVAGLAFNDVVFTALWAAGNPVLLFLLLRSLAARGWSRRTPIDDLWLTLLFGVGSVYYFCAVVGEVWFTAHMVAVTATIGFAWAAIDAHRPRLAGLFVGAMIATRPPALMAVLFVLEAARVSGLVTRVPVAPSLAPAAPSGETAPPAPLAPLPASILRRWVWTTDPRALPAFARRLAAFAWPLGLVLLVLGVHNWVRFENPFEFGHRYLNIGWQERIQRYGLLNYHFLSRNLTAALLLLPRILTRWPFIKISQHGMSLLVTSPALAYTVAPAERSRLALPLWLTVLAEALPSLLYQNSGYIQVGYRFSLDYLVFLVLLIALGGRPLSRLFKLLVLCSIPVNLFLAVIFDRYPEFTYDDSFFPHGFN